VSIENPYATEEAWEVSTGTYLPSGNHLVEVYDIEFERSNNNNPKFVIRLRNGQGETTDWMTVTPNSVGKVVNFTDACSVNRPGEDDVELDAPSGTTIPTLAYMKRTIGKQVGVVIRPEDKYNGQPGEKVDRVQGYVTADRVGGSSSDVPHQNPPSHDPNAPAPSEDIPF
jgi:hypothetical protein